VHRASALNFGFTLAQPDTSMDEKIIRNEIRTLYNPEQYVDKIIAKYRTPWKYQRYCLQVVFLLQG
jgi:hypothetical protein